MAFSQGSAQGGGFILLLFTASLLVLMSEAETIVVGGSKGWSFGFNYTDWAIKNSPFYINDKLVFKYAAPSNTSSHNVYLLPNLWSYINCDFRKARIVADAKQGSGKGFEFVLKQWRPYYFACAVNNGVHCSQGQMKFFAIPWPRPHY
ncbi:hypothetical protein F2P56_012483 [Juglans regia]|uniref:Phytocyanin domain-containing protein n=2 Tax=Juglans regia TaxID=51240 RepID=A0A834CQW9_JUGRE|nr:blue copper protein 1b-like [Juglans regia]KAF5468324.1 hypothetical protein F2P56_012483 [Juglans regia]